MWYGHTRYINALVVERTGAWLELLWFFRGLGGEEGVKVFLKVVPVFVCTSVCRLVIKVVEQNGVSEQIPHHVFGVIQIYKVRFFERDILPETVHSLQEGEFDILLFRAMVGFCSCV